MVPELSNILAKLEHPQAEEALARLEAGSSRARPSGQDQANGPPRYYSNGQRPSPLVRPLRRSTSW